MSRTNVSILLATALLGVLLFVVRQIVVDQPVKPIDVPVATQAEEVFEPVVEPAPVAESGEPLPVVDSPAALRSLITAQDLDADALLADTRDWFEARGFLTKGPLTELVGTSGTNEYLESLDEVTLQSMSWGGDALATQALAARQRLTDPLGALKTYQEAVHQGSVNAWLQMASMRATLAEIRPEDFAIDPQFSRRLRVAGGPDGKQLHVAAYANVLTAMRDGGPAVIDEELLGWAAELESRLTPQQQAAACNRSFNEFVGMTNQRRQRGRAPITVQPPPAFLALPELEARLPCQETVSPVASTQILDACEIRDVVDANAQLRQLYICPP